MYGSGNRSSILPWNNFNTFEDHPFTFHGQSHYGDLFNKIRPQFPCQEVHKMMSDQEIIDAKAIAASKSHSEAERRRRERINNHLTKLRSLLPNTTKTDKASLLAEVIQHVKELKRQTSQIAQTNELIPTEINELTVDYCSDNNEGNFMIKASLCCEDRSDLLPDLINTLKSLRLKILKAEITTLSERVKNVLYITKDQHEDDTWTNDDDQMQYCLTSIQEALKEVMEKSNGNDSGNSGSIKRQRTSNNSIHYLKNRNYCYAANQ